MLRAAPSGHPLQKPTVVQWDIGGMLSADGAADESVSPQSGIIWRISVYMKPPPQRRRIPFDVTVETGCRKLVNPSHLMMISRSSYQHSTLRRMLTAHFKSHLHAAHLRLSLEMMPASI